MTTPQPGTMASAVTAALSVNSVQYIHICMVQQRQVFLEKEQRRQVLTVDTGFVRGRETSKESDSAHSTCADVLLLSLISSLRSRWF